MKILLNNHVFTDQCQVERFNQSLRSQGIASLGLGGDFWLYMGGQGWVIVYGGVSTIQKFNDIPKHEVMGLFKQIGKEVVRVRVGNSNFETIKRACEIAKPFVLMQTSDRADTVTWLHLYLPETINQVFLQSLGIKGEWVTI